MLIQPRNVLRSCSWSSWPTSRPLHNSCFCPPLLPWWPGLWPSEVCCQTWQTLSLPNCQLSEKLFKTTKLHRGRPETEHHWPCHHKSGSHFFKRFMGTFWQVRFWIFVAYPHLVSSWPLQSLPLHWSEQSHLSQPCSKSFCFLPHTFHEILELSGTLVFLYLAKRLPNTLAISSCLGGTGSQESRISAQAGASFRHGIHFKDFGPIDKKQSLRQKAVF